MGSEHADIQDRVNDIATQLGDQLDFQIGLVGYGSRTTYGITGLYGRGQIHTTLTNDTQHVSDAVDLLQTDGNYEPGFNATVVGLSQTIGFRHGAGKCLVIITDEEATNNITPQAPETKADALAALQAQKRHLLRHCYPWWWP